MKRKQECSWRENEGDEEVEKEMRWWIREREVEVSEVHKNIQRRRQKRK